MSQVYSDPSSPKPYILVALNGARRGHSDHARLPLSLAEISRAAHQSFKAGAHGLHLHVRDGQGRHSLDAGLYVEAIEEIERTSPGMDIQITTEAAGVFDVQDQFDCLHRVQPAWASISVREIAREPGLAARVYGLCADQATRVQHILYDATDVALLDRWQAEGVVHADQTDRLLVLGRYAATQSSTPDDLAQFPRCPDRWMVCAFGAGEHACLVQAARQGADVRVGFENSLTDGTGAPWYDNAASVAALVATLERTL